MPFIKGHPNYNLKVSNETKIKLRKSKLGNKNPMFGKIPWNKGKLYMEGSNNPFYGKKHSYETLKRISLANKGRISWMKGKTHTKESREKMRNSHLGKRGFECNNWKGGLTPLMLLIRHNVKSNEWRNKIFQRDNYTCVICKNRGGYLQADHYPRKFSQIIRDKIIISLSEAEKCLELWDINNGRTLCKSCHRNQTFKVSPSQDYKPTV